MSNTELLIFFTNLVFRYSSSSWYLAFIHFLKQNFSFCNSPHPIHHPLLLFLPPKNIWFCHFPPSIHNHPKLNHHHLFSVLFEIAPQLVFLPLSLFVFKNIFSHSNQSYLKTWIRPCHVFFRLIQQFLTVLEIDPYFLGWPTRLNNIIWLLPTFTKLLHHVLLCQSQWPHCHFSNSPSVFWHHCFCTSCSLCPQNSHLNILHS